MIVIGEWIATREEPHCEPENRRRVLQSALKDEIGESMFTVEKKAFLIDHFEPRCIFNGIKAIGGLMA